MCSAADVVNARRTEHDGRLVALLTDGEAFIALAGRATFEFDARAHELSAGDAICVPPHTPFRLTNNPGYAGEGGVVHNPGIQPELYFDLKLIGSPGPGHSFVPKLDELDQTFKMPYDAVAWRVGQGTAGGVSGVRGP